MSTNPRIIELTNELQPKICEFLLQREKEDRPISLHDMNVYLMKQQENGKVSGLTFRGTYSYQVEYVMTNLIGRQILKQRGSCFYLTSHGREVYRKMTNI